MRVRRKFALVNETGGGTIQNRNMALAIYLCLSVHQSIHNPQPTTHTHTHTLSTTINSSALFFQKIRKTLVWSGLRGEKRRRISSTPFKPNQTKPKKHLYSSSKMYLPYLIHPHPRPQLPKRAIHYLVCLISISICN